MIRVDPPRSAGRSGRCVLVLTIGVSALTVAGALGSPQGQAPQPAADGKVLYLVEFVRPDKEDKHVDRLVRATLKPDGSLTSEVVLTVRRNFFGDPGKARIVNKRYIVTEYGGVIDASTGRLLLDQGYGSELLGVEGGQAVYRVHNLLAPRSDGKIPKEVAERVGDWAFDLARGTRARTTEKRWAWSGTPSPDRAKAVFHGATGTLWLDQGDGVRKQLGEDFAVTNGKYAEHPSERRTPVLWLDKERILTQQGNGKLVIVDVRGAVTPVCAIAGAPAVNDSPRLTRDPKNRIIYQCGRAEYVIDVEKKSAAPLEEYALGHGFETPVVTGPRGHRTIYYKGQALGGGVFVPADIRTGPEVIAKWNLGGDPGARRHLAVLWTKLGFAWRGLDMDYCGLIGWVD